MAQLKSTIVNGNLTVTNTILTNSEFITDGTQNAFRAVYGNYSAIFRNDGVGTYILLTDSGNQWGTFNGLRPIGIDNKTGIVTIGNGLCINGALKVDSGIDIDNNGAYIYGEKNSGNILFRFRKTPSSGFAYTNVSYLYYNKLGCKLENEYYGMAGPDGGNSWIRTTSRGLIPYKPGGSTAGNSSLGTNTWYFGESYIQSMHSNNLTNDGTLLNLGLLNSRGSIFLGGNIKFDNAKADGNDVVTRNCTLYKFWADGNSHDILVTYSNQYDTALGWSKGTLNLRGKSIKCNGSTSWSSDRNLKHSIDSINEKYDIFFSLLKPVSYQYDLGSSERYHLGYIAQDVEEALKEAEMTNQDFAGIVSFPIEREQEVDDSGEGYKDVENSDANYLLDKGFNKQYNLAYTEFIALNTHMIQKQGKIIEELKDKIDSLQKQVNSLEQKIN